MRAGHPPAWRVPLSSVKRAAKLQGEGLNIIHRRQRRPARICYKMSRCPSKPVYGSQVVLSPVSPVFSHEPLRARSQVCGVKDLPVLLPPCPRRAAPASMMPTLLFRSVTMPFHPSQRPLPVRRGASPSLVTCEHLRSRLRVRRTSSTTSSPCTMCWSRGSFRKLNTLLDAQSG